MVERRRGQQRSEFSRRINQKEYREILESEYTQEGLTVAFGNGDRVTFDPSPLVPRYVDPSTVKWELTRVRYDGVRHTIVVPSEPSKFSVSWEGIRMATDREFKIFMLKMAAEQNAYYSSLKLGELRRDRKLTQSEVAKDAGMTKYMLSAIENGRIKGYRVSTLMRLLAAMGATVADIERPPRDETIARVGERGRPKLHQ